MFRVVLQIPRLGVPGKKWLYSTQSPVSVNRSTMYSTKQLAPSKSLTKLLFNQSIKTS